MQAKEIFTFENLLEAHKMCRRSKQHKRGTILFEIALGLLIENNHLYSNFSKINLEEGYSERDPTYSEDNYSNYYIKQMEKM